MLFQHCFFELFFGAGAADSRKAFIFCLGVLKSIFANGKNGTVLNAGGSQIQGRDVQENCCFTRVLASAANKTPAMREQTSS